LKKLNLKGRPTNDCIKRELQKPHEPLPWQLKLLKLTKRRMGKLELPSISQPIAGAI
jgi:hypothetical protein